MSCFANCVSVAIFSSSLNAGWTLPGPQAVGPAGDASLPSAVCGAGPPADALPASHTARCPGVARTAGDSASYRSNLRAWRPVGLGATLGMRDPDELSGSSGTQPAPGLGQICGLWASLTLTGSSLLSWQRVATPGHLPAMGSGPIQEAQAQTNVQMHCPPLTGRTSVPLSMENGVTPAGRAMETVRGRWGGRWERRGAPCGAGHPGRKRGLTFMRHWV